MNKEFKISYRKKFGRAGDENGGIQTEFRDRTYSLTQNPEIGIYLLVIGISEHHDWLPNGSVVEERIEIELPRGWSFDHHLLDLLPIGDHQDSELETLWLNFLQTFLSEFETFSYKRRSRDFYKVTYPSSQVLTLQILPEQLEFRHEVSSTRPNLPESRIEGLSLKVRDRRDWPPEFDQEFREWMHLDYDDPEDFEDVPSEEEIVSLLAEASFRKTNHLFEDLVQGLRIQLKGGLQEARLSWDYPRGDFWMHMRLLAKLESEVT